MKREIEGFLVENPGKKERIENVLGELRTALIKGLHDYCKQGGSHYKSQDKALHIISEALIETSDILDVNIPPVQFFVPSVEREDGSNRKINPEDKDSAAELSGLAHNGSLIIRINLFYFLEQTYEVDNLFSEEAGEQRLAKTVAHEIYHAYIAHEYPMADYKTCLANELKGEAYISDRGEIEANLFARKYCETRMR